METAAFLGMLGLGYALSDRTKPAKEGFESQPAPVDKREYTNFYASAVPGVAVQQPPLKYEAPVAVQSSATRELDTLYNFPSGARIPSEPHPDKQGSYLGFPLPAVSYANQTATTAVTSDIRQRTNTVEETPVLAKEKVIVSALTGLPMKPEEFTHANMVPFFRGSPKQNMSDTANRNLLDSYTGGGYFQQEKREQGPMFDAQREPTGTPFGSEIATDFMQDRMVAPTNRSGERPFEQIRVGKGLGEGFTSLPSGGFQQSSALEYARPRGTDELRTANNPKTTYSGVMVPGKNFIAKSGTIGEVRKHAPDRFYLNEKGERNFTTTGAAVKATVRSVQVLRDTSRPETTTAYGGAAKSQEYNATYTVPSTRAPMVKQHGSYGFRNADATTYADKDTDSAQNDYGKSGIEIRPNERFYTGDRTVTFNLKPSEAGQVSMPLQDGPRQTRKDEMLGNPNQAGYVSFSVQKGPAYDPNDVARTTIKETTIDGDYVGTATGPKKLTVFDPDDIARTTVRETTEDNDYVGIVAGPKKLKVHDPNDIARTTVKETTIDNNHLGGAGGPLKLTVYDPDDVARTTIKETTSDNDYVGVAAPNQPQKLTVYDPEDIARITIRNTTNDVDYNRNYGRADNPDASYIPFEDIARVTDREALSAISEYYGNSDPNYPKQIINPYQDGARLTQKASISAKSAYTGSGNAVDKKQLVNPYLDGARATQKAAISAKSSYTGAAKTANAAAPRSEAAERNMRHYAQKENVAKGRAPAGNISLFNGEDYMNLKFNKIESDFINDRSPILSRVVGPPPNEQQIGAMRPRAPLKLDVSAERNQPIIVSGLETNPYVIPLHSVSKKIDAGQSFFDEEGNRVVKAF